MHPVGTRCYGQDRHHPLESRGTASSSGLPGLVVVGPEGAVDEAQWNYLLQVECDYGQGGCHLLGSRGTTLSSGLTGLVVVGPEVAADEAYRNLLSQVGCDAGACFSGRFVLSFSVTQDS